MKHYVIIGNGIAATGCIEGIRAKDKDSKITVISKERHPVYCRPLISYYLEGKTDLEKMGYRSDDFYSNNNCSVIYGEVAKEIDCERKRVIVSSGEALTFSSLCVATGASPFVPPFKGLDTVKKRFSFMTLDDALALEKAITPESKVLIVGAGLIGLKCAEGLHGRVKSITVCDLSDKVLSSILDDETAPTLQQHLEKNGISFLLSDSVSEFKYNEAIMNSGNVVDFDILVTAVGVKANTNLISDIDGSVNRGIVVNEAMQTSIDGIYAAGDCTEGYDISFGGNRVLALLPNAYIQGYTAGNNMAGGSAVFKNAIPMNSIGFFGLHIMTAGSYITEKDGGTVYVQKKSGSLKKFFKSNKCLKGYIMIGSVERGGIYTSLIREQTPLDSIDFELLAENASFVAFSEKSRRKKFGDVI